MKNIKNFFFFLVLLVAGTTVANAQGKWSLDNSHSEVKFTVQHLVISEVTGNFKKFAGDITASKEDFSDLNVNFTIDATSINTDNERRDQHLRGDDFFSTEKFPEIKFVGKSFKKIEGKKYQLTGDMTIRDVTKTVTLDVVFNGTIKDPWGNTKAGFKIIGSINRFDYGLKWNNATEAGGLVVGQDVAFTVNLELKKES